MKGCTDVVRHDPSLRFTLQLILQCMKQIRMRAGAKTFFIYTLLVGSTPPHSTNHRRQTDTRRSSTSDIQNTGIEIHYREEGGTFGIGVTLLSLQQAGEQPKRKRHENVRKIYISRHQIRLTNLITNQSITPTNERSDNQLCCTYAVIRVS